MITGIFPWIVYGKSKFLKFSPDSEWISLKTKNGQEAILK